MSEIETWRFLVSRNQFLDYRTVVAPDFMCKNNIANLLARTAEGDLIDDGLAYYREIHGSKIGDLTIVYQVREAQAKDINNNGEGILKDPFGREIHLIEGVVLQGIHDSFAVTHEHLESNHKKLVEDYRNFWEWVSPQPAIPSASKPIVLKSNEEVILQYEKLPEYILSKEKNKNFSESPRKTSPETTQIVKKVFPLGGEVSSIVFYTDSIVIARFEQTIARINLNNKKYSSFAKGRTLWGGNASPLTVNRIKKLLATCLIEGADQNIIRVWAINSDFTSRKLGGEKEIGGFKRVNAINFSHDGEIVASGGNNKIIKLWDVGDVEGAGSRGEFTLHEGDIKCIESSPLDNIFASSDSQGSVMIWNWKSLEKMYSLDLDTAVDALAFSPKEKILVAGSNDGKITIISYKNNKMTDEGLLGEHRGSVNTLAFSPDGKMVASGGSDRKIKLWNVKKKEQIMEFSEHIDSVMSVSFSPNGKLLASGSKDKTVRIWQIS